VDDFAALLKRIDRVHRDGIGLPIQQARQPHLLPSEVIGKILLVELVDLFLYLQHEGPPRYFTQLRVQSAVVVPIDFFFGISVWERLNECTFSAHCESPISPLKTSVRWSAAR
jgi:hypothetical protein